MVVGESRFYNISATRKLIKQSALNNQKTVPTTDCLHNNRKPDYTQAKKFMIWVQF